MSIKQLIEAQRHQQSTGETCNAILQHMLSSKEELAILHHDIKQLHSNHGGESSQPLDMINDRLQLLADELKSSNAEHRESILSLKVRRFYVQIQFVSTFTSGLIVVLSHNIGKLRQRTSGKHYKRN